MNRFFICIYIFLLSFLTIKSYAFNQQQDKRERNNKIVEASITYKFQVPESMSMNEARLKAEEEAKCEILAREFGVALHSTTEQTLNDDNSHFYTHNQQEYKGEWIETLYGPDFKVKIEDNHQVLEVTIKGAVREIVSSKVLYDYKVLRNGVDEKYVDTEFKNGDDLYVSFQSPEDGYLAIYLSDKSIVQRLLPYKMQKESVYRISKNKRYVFFSPEYAEETLNNLVTPLCIYTDFQTEYNYIYIVFSPNKFSIANDFQLEIDEHLQGLKYENFQKWLARMRAQDYDMNYDVVNIKITQ